MTEFKAQSGSNPRCQDLRQYIIQQLKFQNHMKVLESLIQCSLSMRPFFYVYNEHSYIICEIF